MYTDVLIWTSYSKVTYTLYLEMYGYTMVKCQLYMYMYM